MIKREPVSVLNKLMDTKEAAKKTGKLKLSVIIISCNISVLI